MDASVNSYLPKVNTHLPGCGYFADMAQKKGGKRGSPFGQSKPFGRRLDINFPKRFKEAMALGGFEAPDGKFRIQALADEIGCTKQTLYNWLKGPATVDAMLLYDVADRCGVSGRWLLKSDVGKFDGVRPPSKLRGDVSTAKRTQKADRVTI